VELDGLAFPYNVPNRHGSGLLIRSDQIPDEEVASLEMAPLLIDHNAKMQGVMRIASVRPSQRLKYILESCQGCNAAEFINKVLLCPSNDKPFSDRTTALRGHGSDSDRSGELHSYDSLVKALIIEEQSIFSRILPATGEAPDNCAMGVPVCHNG